jgi:hypothetical protein
VAAAIAWSVAGSATVTSVPPDSDGSSTGFVEPTRTVEMRTPRCAANSTPSWKFDSKSSPSDTKRITRVRAGSGTSSTRKDSARAARKFVPGSTSGASRWDRRMSVVTALRSVVNGARENALPANTTSPTRLPVMWVSNSRRPSEAASARLGRMSCASIERDTSSAITRSMPRCGSEPSPVPHCGRAAASTASTTAATTSADVTARSRCP